MLLLLSRGRRELNFSLSLSLARSPLFSRFEYSRKSISRSSFSTIRRIFWPPPVLQVPITYLLTLFSTYLIQPPPPTLFIITTRKLLRRGGCGGLEVCSVVFLSTDRPGRAFRGQANSRSCGFMFFSLLILGPTIILTASPGRSSLASILCPSFLRLPYFLPGLSPRARGCPPPPPPPR